jgi:hypothetical protein
VQALKDRKKRRRANDDAKPQETKRAALRAVDANGCLDLVLDDAEPKLPPPPPPPSPTKRNAVLSPMARRLDEAIVSACRVPYQPGALEAMINLVVEQSSANFMRPADGATPLHAAAFVGDAQACRALLSLGADPALADALGQGAAVVPACGETWTECDGYVLDDGAASSDGEPDYDSNAEDAAANDYPDEDEDPWCREDDEVFDDSDDEGAPRFEAVQPAWAEDHPDCLATPCEVAQY